MRLAEGFLNGDAGTARISLVVRRSRKGASKLRIWGDVGDATIGLRASGLRDQ